MKGEALIRANLHIDPSVMESEEWGKSYTQALWLEQMRLKNFADLLLGLFNGDK
ncbi:MAG: hypothetical protein R3Y59_04610 [bacterium]